MIIDFFKKKLSERFQFILNNKKNRNRKNERDDIFNVHFTELCRFGRLQDVKSYYEEHKDKIDLQYKNNFMLKRASSRPDNLVLKYLIIDLNLERTIEIENFLDHAIEAKRIFDIRDLKYKLNNSLPLDDFSKNKAKI